MDCARLRDLMRGWTFAGYSLTYPLLLSKYGTVHSRLGRLEGARRCAGPVPGSDPEFLPLPEVGCHRCLDKGHELWGRGSCALRIAENNFTPRRWNLSPSAKPASLGLS